MRDGNKELQAIELGKEWMRRSVNLVHDYRHAENVEKHSQKIFNELKNEGLLTEEDRNITLLAVWWHDSYKAQEERDNLLHGFLFEGFESEKIFRREVGHLLSEDVLNRVSEIIRYHNYLAPVFLIWRSKYTPLSRTLYEADYMEGYNSTRIKESRQMYGFLFKILSNVYFKVYPFIANLLPQTEYLKNYLRERK